MKPCHNWTRHYGADGRITSYSHPTCGMVILVSYPGDRRVYIPSHAPALRCTTLAMAEHSEEAAFRAFVAAAREESERIAADKKARREARQIADEVAAIRAESEAASQWGEMFGVVVAVLFMALLCAAGGCGVSSTNRGAGRVTLDAYYTPDAVARACVATIAADVRGATVLEPHAGGGAFVRALLEAGADTVASDINPEAPALVDELGTYGLHARDFIADGETWPDVGWVAGNPPFNEAEAHVRRALDLSTVGVAFLLRLAFLESAKRADFWREHPPAEVHVFTNRPSFTCGGTDSAAYAWFVWRAGWDREPVLRWLDWRAA